MIGFVGLSHLGIVSSIAAASKGLEVIAYDPDAALCEGLRGGRLPILEPGLPELLAESHPRMQFTADPLALRRCAVIVLSADVPTDRDHQSDLSRIDHLIETAIAPAASDAALVILSQVPPGFTRAVDDRVRRAFPGRDVPVFYQAETLVFGRAVERALYPERFMVGCRDPQQALPAPYAELLQAFACPVFRMRYESAELAKLAVNLFLVSSICTANTLAELCEAIGADWSEIMPALTLDKRIGPHAYVKPGLGLAGGNLERDLATVHRLAQVCGTDAGIVEAWRSNSAHRRDWVLTLLHDEVIAKIQDPVMAIWGLAYKPHTASIKNAPALDLLETLRPFTLRVYDPQVVLSPGGVPAGVQVSSALEACRGADALVVMTPWPEFALIDPQAIRQAMRGRVVIDPFGVLDGRHCAELGLIRFQLGSPVERQREPATC